MTARRFRGAIARVVVVLISLAVPAAAAAAEPPGALPLDLAYSRREVVRGEARPALSPDGRYLAYEIESPRVRTPGMEGEIETRFLPDGTPSNYAGWRLWVTEVGSGASRAVCAEPVNCWRGSWSPDSQRLAYYSNEGGAVRLWLYEAATGASRKVSEARIKVKLWPGDEAAWSADGRQVFVPVLPEGSAPQPGAAPAAAPPAKAAPAATEAMGATDPIELGKPTVKTYRTSKSTAAPGEPPAQDFAPLNAMLLAENNADLAAIDIASGKAQVVVPATAEPRPSCLRLSPDGRWISYLSVFRVLGMDIAKIPFDLAIAPAAGGKPLLVAADLHSPEDDYFGATYRWTPDGRGIVFMKGKRLWLAPVTARGPGKPRQLASGLGELSAQPLLLTTDGKGVVVGLEAEGEKTYYSVPAKALAVVPLDGGAPKVLPFTGQPLAADRQRLWQPENGFLWILRDVEGAAQREIVRVDPVSGAVEQKWVGQGRFDFVGSVPEGGMVARFEGLATPPDYYLFSDGFAGRRRITHAEPRLDAVTIGPMESFTTVIPGHDGRLTPVQTAIFLPAGAKRGDRLPTLVYFYAGSPFSRHAQDYGGGAPNSIPVQVFTSRGYAVLFCDVPLGPQGVGGNPVQEMTEAVLAQLYRAAELGYTDIGRTAIMGQSYGAYSTAAIITETNVFRAAMALDGVYDLAGNFGWMDPHGMNVSFLWSETGQGRMGNHPWADLRRYLANSPYYQADKIHTPLLLIHGKQDDACPVQEAEKMFNALKRLGREAELAIYEGEGHVPGEWALVNAIDATQRLLDFMEKHLGKK